MVVKLTAEQIQLLGGLKDASEFGAKLNDLAAKAGEAKTENKVVSLADVQSLFTSQFATIHADVKANKDAIAAVNPDALVAKAEAAGSAAAAKALGAVGANGAGDAKGSANDGTTPNASAALIASGDFEGAWKADKNIQAEWPDVGAYAGYMKASAKGMVRINSK